MTATPPAPTKPARRFLPTVNLWDEQTHNDIVSGKLVLVPGQWVRCGQERPSRFVRWTGVSMQAVHPHGAKGVSNARFKDAVANWPR